ncbi:MAG TPA: hypothetical protein DEH78_14915 [Solibacterales bacterium]|nr:hypothetical protein [Bryobacterales bacterium]
MRLDRADLQTQLDWCDRELARMAAQTGARALLTALGEQDLLRERELIQAELRKHQPGPLKGGPR